MPLLRNRLVPIAPPRLIMMIWLRVRSLCRPLSRATIEVSSKRPVPRQSECPEGPRLRLREAIASRLAVPEACMRRRACNGRLQPSATGFHRGALIYFGNWKWCRLRDSNTRPPHYECDALPTELRRPATRGWADGRETTHPGRRLQPQFLPV